MVIALRKYQTNVIRKLNRYGSALCFMPLGAGNTTCNLVYASHLLKARKIKRAIIVTSKPKCDYWLKEVDKIFGGKLKGVVVGHDQNGNLRTLKERTQLLNENYDIYVINFELIGDLCTADLLIVDGIEHVKNDTKRLRLMQTIPTKYRVGMSCRMGLSNNDDISDIIKWITPENRKIVVNY